MGISQHIYNWILNLPEEVAVVIMGTLPVFELRLAIPVGIIKFHLGAVNVYFLSVLGNLLPVLPLLFFFKCFFHRLADIRVIGKFFEWWFKSVERRSEIIRKWGFWGLVCFVAIPLPVTGAWTGTAAAALFGMRTKRAFLAITIGVLISGVIVGCLSMLVPELIKQWCNLNR